MSLSKRKTGSAFASLLRRLTARIEADRGQHRVVSRLLTDGGRGISLAGEVARVCEERGIVQEVTPPYSQHLNPVERTIRTLLDTTRALLHHAGAPPALWGHAFLYAALIHNRVPRQGKTPMERWLGRDLPHDRDHLRVFGCAAWPLDFTAGRDKTAPTARMHVLLGMDAASASTHTYLLGELPALKIRRSGNCTFNEALLPLRGSSHPLRDHKLLEYPAPHDALAMPPAGPSLEFHEPLPPHDLAGNAGGRRARAYPQRPHYVQFLTRTNRRVPLHPTHLLLNPAMG